MIESTITFKLRGKPKKFIVLHNLDEFGIEIDAAFENWWVRARNFSIQSFCKYVVSKDPLNIYCKPVLKNPQS